jgi:hypothetical protein
MKGLFSLRFGLSVLLLIITLAAHGATIWGQNSCVDRCLEDLALCGDSGACEDQYQACIDHCG